MAQCEYCGNRLKPPYEEVVWYDGYPHHPDCMNALLNEIAHEERVTPLHPDDPRSTR